MAPIDHKKFLMHNFSALLWCLMCLHGQANYLESSAKNFAAFIIINYCSVSSSGSGSSGSGFGSGSDSLKLDPQESSESSEPSLS